MSFIVAADLKKIFSTEGVFYRLNVGGIDYECRGVARILRKNVVCEEADALVVMVNPGSCKPVDDSYVYPLYQEDVFAIPFVAAREDPTQYQLMRLMERMDWNMVYIINLSDLRAGNINEYISIKNTLTIAGRSEHSLFSEERRKAIHQLVADQTRVLAAWGKNRTIRKDAVEAHDYLSDHFTIEGLPYKEFPFYRHPKPRMKKLSIQWLDVMCEVLKDKEAT